MRKVNEKVKSQDGRKAISKPHTGWLKNPQRKARRDSPLTLTDEQVEKLIQKLEQLTSYSRSMSKLDYLLKMRDEALIALNWIFFKRGNELLHIRFGDVMVTKQELMVSLLIEKKQKRYKLCPRCSKTDLKLKNSLKANYCKKCGRDISRAEIVTVGQKPEKKVKHKELANPFCKYIVKWYKQLESMGATNDWWVFPRSHYFSGTFLWKGKAPLTIQQYDHILQRIDPTMSSCMFRYGHTEELYMLGYNSHEIKEIGDWSSEAQPERYAERKGLRKSERDFSKDHRTL